MYEMLKWTYIIKEGKREEFFNKVNEIGILLYM